MGWQKLTSRSVLRMGLELLHSETGITYVMEHIRDGGVVLVSMFDHNGYWIPNEENTRLWVDLANLESYDLYFDLERTPRVQVTYGGK